MEIRIRRVPFTRRIGKILDAKIEKFTLIGDDEIIITFKEQQEPTVGDLQAIMAILKTSEWEQIETA